MKKMMQQGIGWIQHSYCRCGVFISLLLCYPTLFAAIPAAPTIPGGNQSDYIKVGSALANEGAGIGIILFYVFAILAYCGGLLFLLMRAKKHKEWGEFAKGALIGLIVLVLVLILLNQAKTAIGPA